MKKFALFAVLALLVAPCLVFAETPQLASKDAVNDLQVSQPAMLVEHEQLLEPAYPALQESSQYTAAPRAEQVRWYQAANGYYYSNICQTPDFWVNFGNRYYLVDSACVATLNGVTEYGVMVAR